MPIEFHCSHCGRLLRTGDDTAGRMAQCPECGTQTQVPVPVPAAPLSAEGIVPAPGVAADGNSYQSSGPFAPIPPVGLGDPANSGKATASLVLGIIGLVMSLCCPLVGLASAVVGLVLGILGLNSPKRGLAIAGIVLSSAAILIGVLNMILGAIWALQGNPMWIPR